MGWVCSQCALESSEGGQTIAIPTLNVCEFGQSSGVSRFEGECRDAMRLGLVQSAKFSQLDRGLNLQTDLCWMGSYRGFERGERGLSVAALACDVSEFHQGGCMLRLDRQGSTTHDLRLIQTAERS